MIIDLEGKEKSLVVVVEGKGRALVVVLRHFRVLELQFCVLRRYSILAGALLKVLIKRFSQKFFI